MRKDGRQKETTRDPGPPPRMFVNKQKETTISEKYKDKWEILQGKEGYGLLVKSGMFWEIFPELTGEWVKDSPLFEEDIHKKLDMYEQAVQEIMRKHK